MTQARRPAATLIEVLVAIFVMAIGLMALLVMFPLGALRMGQAIQDHRTLNAGHNAMAMAQAWNVALNGGVTPAYTDPSVAGQPPVPTILQPKAGEPSFPVLVDPAGQIQAVGFPRTWVGGIDGFAVVARRSFNFPGIATTFPVIAPAATRNRLLALRWFTFLDDLYFDADGVPLKAVPGLTPEFEREVRYSYAVLCQQPDIAKPTVINMAVVVYNKRPLVLSVAADLYETVYGNTFSAPAPGPGVGTSRVIYDTTRNVIEVQVLSTNPFPNVRIGDWVLDATSTLPAGVLPPPSGTGRAVRHAFFYRVVGISELPPTPPMNRIEYEVQQPLRGFPLGQSLGTLIVMEGVAEVYERGDDRP